MQHLNKILSETHPMPRIPRISDDNHTSTNETALHQLKTTTCTPGVIREFSRVKACIVALSCLCFIPFHS